MISWGENGLMKTHHRGRLAIALVAAISVVVPAALCGHGAWSQTPTTIKIVVPYTPGSGPDILSRLMAEQVGRMHGPAILVENRPGGGRLIGTEAAARAAPDGNTLLLVANSFVINAVLKRQSYDPLTSFEPICH